MSCTCYPPLLAQSPLTLCNVIPSSQWSYLYLLCHIATKDCTEYNGWEQYIADKIKNGDVSFVPHNSAIVLRDHMIAEEGEKTRLLDHIERLGDRLDRLAAPHEGDSSVAVLGERLDEIHLTLERSQEQMMGLLAASSRADKQAAPAPTALAPRRSFCTFGASSAPTIEPAASSSSPQVLSSAPSPAPLAETSTHSGFTMPAGREHRTFDAATTERKPTALLSGDGSASTLELSGERTLDPSPSGSKQEQWRSSYRYSSSPALGPAPANSSPAPAHAQS